MTRRVPIHPFLLAVYPVVFLYGENLGEASPGDAVPPLLGVLLLAGLLYLVARLVFRSATRAALAASLVVVVALEYGRVLGVVQGTPIAGGRLLVVAGVGTLIGLVLIARSRQEWLGLNRALDILSVILVAVALSGVLAYEVPRAMTAAGPTAGASADPSVGSGTAATTRDIFYIVVEDLGAPKTLVDHYGLSDTHAFDWLAQLGFQVPDESATNYGKTIHMLASTFNMSYLDDVAASAGTQSGDYHPLYRMVDDNTAARFLKAHGYRYVHIGSWWDPTEESSIADVNYGISAPSDFAAAFLNTTLAPEVIKRLPRLGIRLPASFDPSGVEAQRDGAVFGFQKLLDLAATPGPKFVFAHVLIPHDPYVFREDGTSVAAAEGGSEADVRAAFLAQALYTNRRLEEVARALLAGPEATRPIVVIQTDEGPNPPRYEKDPDRFDWTRATDEELQIKYPVLNAMYLPGLTGEDAVVAPSITTVNTFRLIFDRYFGAGLGLLPDRLFVYRNKSHPYDFTDVTTRLRP
jgi:hypothetical protein